MGITTLRRRHDLVEVAVVDEREPTELEQAQQSALEARDAAADAVTAFKAEHEDWEQFASDEDSDEFKELAARELAAQDAEDALTEATNAAEDERRRRDIVDAQPKGDAPVADWRAWAVEHLGLTEDDAKALDKAKLKKLEIK